MNRRQIDQFFTAVDRQLQSPARVIVTGAAAGALWGHVRPSLDIDFAIHASQAKTTWADIEAAVEQAKQMTGVAANYAIDIDRWGAISLMDYRRHTHRYKVFGRLAVHLLDPAYWTIGKLTRYLQPDIEDIVAVLKRRRHACEPLVRLWGLALSKSPRSASCAQFRRQVEDFLGRHGRRVWGRAFDSAHAIRLFRDAAGYRP